MGLTDWWLSRSPEASSATVDKAKASSSTSTSSTISGGFRWPLKRAKTEPRKNQHAAQSLKLHAVSKAVAAFKTCAPPSETLEINTSMLSSRLMHLRGLTTVGVNQAKDLIQQCAAVVSLYPSLVQLTMPCVSIKEPTNAVDQLEPECEPEPATSEDWVASESLRRFEDYTQSLVTNHQLDSRLASDGCGGVYILHDASAVNAAPFAVFKPRDEEYMAPKNPRGYVKDGAIVGVTEHPVNKGFRVGNGALRERAAYLMDEAYGNFSGVPMTSLLSLPMANGEQKEGSIQAFVESECSAEDMGSLKFSVPEVHKVGILDIRLFNTDRHAGNILLSKPSTASATYEMTPIDHGFCLPSYKHLDNANFDWIHWPQAKFPFTCEELDHIAALDADRDASLLRSLHLEEECITTMRICTALLKAGAEAGFSLFEIGSFLQRDGDFSQPSELEKIVTETTERVKATVQLEKASVAFGDVLVKEVVKAVMAMLAGQKPKKKVRSMSCFS